MAHLTRDQLEAYARVGAIARLAAIHKEIAALFAEFPGLRDQEYRKRGTTSDDNPDVDSRGRRIGLRRKPQVDDVDSMGRRIPKISDAERRRRSRKMSLLMKRRHATLRAAGKRSQNGGRYRPVEDRDRAIKGRAVLSTEPPKRADANSGQSAGRRYSTKQRRTLSQAMKLSWARRRAAVATLEQPTPPPVDA